ncbi:hypothetical protein OC834_005466 [Tilletia horrida]|nr:hypothetical protein OC834_005466 [Tilletia horrida]
MSDPSDGMLLAPAASASAAAASTPMGSPSPSTDAESSSKRRPNPLVDLIETETAYVAELASIIKKVASAWSRHNFPPPELDTMFRNIEAVYRANRGFLKSLREIGPNPSSPKALGDLLMRWIDDLDGPYTRFCDNFFSNFDNWPAVQSNSKLPVLLAEISQPPADGSAPIFSDRKRQPDEAWTLDGLFSLPHVRLKYYKKLYARLLKSTQPGRSDHRLLVLANEKLDELLERSKSRITMSLLDETPAGASTDRGSGTSFPGTNETADSMSRDRLSSATSMSAGRASNASGPGSQFKSPAGSPPLQAQSSQGHSGRSSHQDMSGPPSAHASIPGHPQGAQSASASTITPMLGALGALSAPATSITHIEELESRLDTSSTLDIFTMNPKQCQLRMNPPELPFRRELRRSADVVIYFTPTATGQEIVTRRAHIVLLTDLFLMCERMGASERSQSATPDKDMRLMYPPLGGKHVRVTDLGGMGNSISLLIAKKETLTVMLESREAKDAWIADFERSKDFAANLGLTLSTQGAPGQPPGPPTGGSLSGASPAISVTPSPGTDPSTSLDRANSFTSVQSFPKGPLGSTSGTASPDSRFPPGTRSPSPVSTGSPDLRGGSSPGVPPPLMNGRGPGPGPGGMMMMMSPPGGPMHMQGMPRGMSPGPGNMPPGGMGPGGMPMRPGAALPPGGGPGGPPRMNGSGGPPGGPPNVPPNPYANGSRPMPGGGPGPGPGPGPGGRPGMPPLPGGAGRGGPPSPANGRLPGAVGPPPPRLPGGVPPPPGWTSSPTGPPGAGPGPGQGQGGGPQRRPSAPDMRSGLKAPPPGGTNGSGGYASDSAPHRTRSVTSEGSAPPALPSEMMKQGLSRANTRDDLSPPSSPQQGRREVGNSSSVVAAQMRCKLFLKQNHAQWKALGNARLKLYHLMPSNERQLVVENDKKRLISTLVLSDGVERVGKVGIAVELSDRGARTGIVYMLQMRSEDSAVGLFGLLLEGSGRSGR